MDFQLESCSLAAKYDGYAQEVLGMSEDLSGYNALMEVVRRGNNHEWFNLRQLALGHAESVAPRLLIRTVTTDDVFV